MAFMFVTGREKDLPKHYNTIDFYTSHNRLFYGAMGECVARNNNNRRSKHIIAMFMM